MPSAKLRYVLVFITSTILFLIVYSVGFVRNKQDLRTERENKGESEYDPTSTKDITYKIFDLDLNFVLNNNKMCENNSNILTLIMVTSYFGNIETRSAMRRSYSREDLKRINIRRVFLLGKSPDDKYITQQSVENESTRFGDIIQGNFREAYRNLTYKHVMGLLWVQEYCPNTKFVIKMDDDIVVNVERLPLLLNSLKLLPESKPFISGYILRNMKPIREPANKWYVTQEEYSSSSYPDFVSGWFYITTPKTCSGLMNLTKSKKYFWIDDTYVTGILAKKLKVRLFDISKNFTVHSEFIDCCINGIRRGNLNCDIMIGPNGGNNNLFYDFNLAMNVCNLNLCIPRDVPLNETCVAEKKSYLGRGNAFVEPYKLH